MVAGFDSLFDDTQQFRGDVMITPLAAGYNETISITPRLRHQTLIHITESVMKLRSVSVSFLSPVYTIREAESLTVINEIF